MRFLIFAMCLPGACFAEAAHIRFSVTHFDFHCKNEQDVPLGQEVVLCEKTEAGIHVRVRSRVRKKADNIYLVRTFIEEIDKNGKVNLVSSPMMMAAQGQPSEISTATDNVVDVNYTVTVTPAR